MKIECPQHGSVQAYVDRNHNAWCPQCRDKAVAEALEDPETLAKVVHAMKLPPRPGGLSMSSSVPVPEVRNPWGIVFIPQDNDPHGLLASDPCGGQPPRAWWGLTSGWREGDDGNNYREARPGDALVLYWKGKVLRSGCDRLAQSVYKATDGFYREFWGEIYDPGDLGLDEVLKLARWCAADNLLEGESLGEVRLLYKCEGCDGEGFTKSWARGELECEACKATCFEKTGRP